MKVEEFENDGFFILSQSPGGEFGYVNLDGSELGIGGGMQLWRFQSAEGRTYFKRTLELDQLLGIANANTRALERGVLECVTPKGRIRMKRFKKLVESIKSV